MKTIRVECALATISSPKYYTKEIRQELADFQAEMEGNGENQRDSLRQLQSVGRLPQL